MAKGDKSKLQTQPPYGIKRKAWAGHNNRSEHTSKHRPGQFSISCAEPGCHYVQSSTGNPSQDKAVRCGVDAPRVCPEGHHYPRGGYVNV